MTNGYQPKDTMNVSECRQHLPAIIDGLPKRGVIITRRGRPVAKLTPLSSGSVDNRRLFGALKGVLKVQGDILSTGDRWDAES
jgi:antitoxin (DNA-binding transcriptional repressor) of toxin-antitoxin stability system